MADDDNYDSGDYENYESGEFEKEEESYDVLPDSNGPSNPRDRRRRSTASTRTSQNGYPPGARTSQNGYQSTRMSTNGLSGPDKNLTDVQRKVGLKRLKESLQKKAFVKLEEYIEDDMFAMMGISQADLYGMARSVYANRKIGSTQCHDDDKVVECQTDDIDTSIQQCQVPEDLAQGKAQDVAVRMTEMDPEVERKLNNFIQWAGPLVLAGMGMAIKTKILAIPSDSAGKGLSGGVAQLLYPALLQDRPVMAVSFDPGSSPNLLVAYGPVNASLGAAALLTDHTLGARGCLCVWDMSDLATPAHVLVSEGTPTSCCWAPPPTVGMVFAGMDEGGVCVWDLEENESHHPSEQVVPAGEGPPTVTRRPSYSTECLANESSAAPIVAISALTKEGSRMTPCHVISLTAWGEVTVYTLSVLNSLEMANADIDLGMRYGSKVRLMKTNSNIKLGMNVLVAPNYSKKSNAADLLQTFSLGVFPGVSRQFIVGSDAGKVLRGSWVGQPPAPKEYLGDMPPKTMSAAKAIAFSPLVASSVTSIHISPFCPQAFLAGHDDGTVVLHSTEISTPVYMWPTVVRGKVSVVRWSPVRPCAFYVLDGGCTLYSFDLVHKSGRNAPVCTEVFLSKDKEGTAVFSTVFEIAHIYNGPTGAGDGKAAFAVGYDDGRVDIHLLNKKHQEAGGNELKSLTALCEPPRKLVKKAVVVLPDKFEGDDDLPQANNKETKKETGSWKI